MAQKSCPSGAPARAAASCHRGNPRQHRQVHPRPGSVGRRLDAFHSQGRQSIDAGISRADEHDIPSLGSERKSEPRPLGFLAEGQRMPLGMAEKIAREIEVEAVADRRFRRQEGVARPPAREKPDRPAPGR